MVFGVGELNYASHIWFRQTLLPWQRKFLIFNTKSVTT